MAFLAGRKLRASELDTMEDDIAALDTTVSARGYPVCGQWLTNDGSATSGTTEKLVATTPSFTPAPNMVYQVKFVFRYATDGSALGDIFFTRIRETSIAGTIQSASRIDPPANSSSPIQAHEVDYWFTSGATPSSTVFVGTVHRNSGDGAVTPLAFSSVVVYVMGTAAQFTSV